MWEECLPRSIPISVTFCMIASPERNRDKEYGSQGVGEAISLRIKYILQAIKQLLLFSALTNGQSAVNMHPVLKEFLHSSVGRTADC
ncbi:hypothetical protein XNW1_510010 [Xenorhabdus nematophila str. Websteri]|nr:hypothetical protein XNW1_4440010 [Xenorhabdus nematophila str. Websteri]CEF33792.1 hypothetical protein XNW1_510010 [Xenorhabdus nematophila str. Websteri]